MGFRRCSHTAWRKLDDEWVVIDLKRKTMFGMNRSGGLVWEALSEARSGEDLARIGQDHWSAPAITDFCEHLVHLELLERSTPGPQGTQRPCQSSMVNPPVDPPAIMWTEAIQQAAGTCAFLPGQSQLCTQAPFD